MIIEDIEFESVYEMAKRFLTLPSVEALVPINPVKWPSYYAGCLFSEGVPKNLPDYLRPLDNCRTAGNYIRFSHNASHRFTRVTEVLLDTLEINAMASSDIAVGPSLAGRLANEKAKGYVKTFIKDDKLVDCLKRKALIAERRRALGMVQNESKNVVHWKPPIGGGNNVPSIFTEGAGQIPRFHGNIPPIAGMTNHANHTRGSIRYPSWRNRGLFIEPPYDTKFSIDKRFILFFSRNKFKILILILLGLLYFLLKQRRLQRRMMRVYNLAVYGG